MANDTLTLALEGDRIPLERFAAAAEHFAALVRALSDAVDARTLTWEVERLETSSAIMTARGVDEREQDGALTRVTSSYIEVGRALGRGVTIPFPSRVSDEARALAQVLRDGVEALRFENAETEIIVRQAPAPATAPQPTELVAQHAYGAVTGRVQTLSSRSRLRFTLYDLLSDRAVNCYVSEGETTLMADIWDKLATVEGMVTRDPIAGRPLNVRQITRITVHEPADPGGYQQLAAQSPGARESLGLRIGSDACAMADKPPLIYWDANVFLSYVDGDQDRIPDIDEFFRKARAGEVEIVTSTLSIVEVAFGSEEKSGGALDPETEAAIDELWKPGGAVTLVEFFPLIALDARGLIRSAMIRGWSLPADAIHPATAKRLTVSAVHSYDGGWPKYSPDIGCPIGEPQHPQLTFPPTTPDVG